MAAKRRDLGAVYRVMALVVAGLGLAACANQVILTSRDGGPGGAGAATGSMGSHGALKIILEGKPYVGEWVVSADGGFSGFSSDAAKTNAKPTAFASANLAAARGIISAGYAGNGDGRAFAKAADGQTLRCNFHLNTVTSNATGLCERGDGRLYDMSMKQ
jgi:hypothetical protein